MSTLEELQVLNNTVDKANLEDFEKLLEEGIGINDIDDKGCTLLMNIIINMSVGSSDCEVYQKMISLLLKCKELNINIKNADGNTALHLAAMFKLFEVVNMLLEVNNINFSIQNKEGKTAGQLAKDSKADHIVGVIDESFKKQNNQLTEPMKGGSLEWDRLIKPSQVKMIAKDNCCEADVVLEPLERGYGLTLGNALRRVMLSSLSGAAVYGIEIDGVSHEFTSISGVKEDITDIILNISMLHVKLSSVTKKCLYLRAKGPAEVRASMIESDNESTIINGDLLICTLGQDVDFKMKIYVGSGEGYTPIVKYKDDKQTKLYNTAVGFIHVNPLYNIVNRVSFKVESSRIGQVTDYDKLIMSVKTNGSLSPDKAVALAAKILREQLQPFVAFGNIEGEKKISGNECLPFHPNLLRRVDELELSVRAHNCLKSQNITYIGDLVKKAEPEMLKTSNFGRKTLNEIKDVLSRFSLSFGMSIPEWPPNNIEELIKKHADDLR